MNILRRSFFVISLFLFFCLSFDTALSKTVDVSFKSQVPPGIWKETRNCGQTSYLMLDAYYGGKDVGEQDIKDLDDWIEKKFGDNKRNYSGNYTSVDKLKTVAVEYGNYKPENVVIDHSGSFEKIKKFIDAGTPVIVGVYTNMYLYGKDDVLHFMLLTGYDDTSVYVNDPGKTQGKGNKYTIEQFMLAWSKNNYATVIFDIDKQEPLDPPQDPLPPPTIFQSITSFISNIFQPSTPNEQVEAEGGTTLGTTDQTTIVELNEQEIPKPVPDVFDADIISNNELITVPFEQKDLVLHLQAQNTGNTIWQRGQVFINVVGGAVSNAEWRDPSWLTALRPGSFEEQTIPPEGIATFSARITIPKKAGTHTFTLQLVQQSESGFVQLGTDLYTATITREEKKEEVKEVEKPEETIVKPPIIETIKEVIDKVIDTIVDHAQETVKTIVDTSKTFFGGGGGGNSVPAPEVIEETEQVEERELPEMTIITPSTTYYTSVSSTSISGTKNSVATIVVNENETVATYPTDTSWQVNIPLNEGENVFVLYAKTDRDTTATSSVHIILDTTIPLAPTIVTIQTPGEQATVISSWNTSEADVVYDVDMKKNSSEWETVATSTASTTAQFDATLLDTYLVRARATDLAGNVSGWGYSTTTTVDWTKEVVINELAWMGSEQGQNWNTRCQDHEWVELKNTSVQDIDLTGWTIDIDTEIASSTILLSGNISSGGFFVIGRPVDGRNVFADMALDSVYTDTTIPDSGARIRLKNGEGIIIDELDFINGWPAGDVNPQKRPMARIASSLPGSLADNWKTEQGISSYATTDRCGTLYGTPKTENDRVWLLYNIANTYPDLIENGNIIHLTAEHSPYVLYQFGTTIPSNYTLLIDPGVVLIGQTKNAYLHIDGNLTVAGTAEEPVAFTSARDTTFGNWHIPYFRSLEISETPSSGDWSRIEIASGAVADIDHASFLYGGQGFNISAGAMFGSKYYANAIRNFGTLTLSNSIVSQTYVRGNSGDYPASLWVENATTTITSSTFDTGYAAIRVAPNASGGSLSVSDSTFQHFTASYGVIDAGSLVPKLSHNVFQDNAGDSISVGTLKVTEDMFLDHIVYRVSEVIVDAGATLMLGPASNIILWSRGDVVVNGTLRVEGTAEEPVQIHGSSWGALRLNGGTHTLSHARIYGGGLGYENRKMTVQINASTATFDHVSITDGRIPSTLIESNGSTTTFRNSVVGWSSPLNVPYYSWLFIGIKLNGGFLHLDNTNFENLTHGIEAYANYTVTTENMSLSHFTNIRDMNWWPKSLMKLE